MSNRRDFLKQLLSIPLVIRTAQVITATPEPETPDAPLEVEGTFDVPYQHVSYNGRITVKGTAHNRAEREEFAGIMDKLARNARRSIDREVFKVAKRRG